MTRVASLYLPHWPIDRLRRAERVARPPADAGPSFDALGEAAAAERATQCSVPRDGHWRPGARWARGAGSGPESGPADSREQVEAAVDALPAHRRPPQRELGRVSEAADHPFKGTAREMARRTQAAEHPFAPGARGAQWLAPDALDAAIAALPAHQRPSFGQLSRRSEVSDHPFRPMPPDEVGGGPVLRQALPPLRFPGEDAPAKAGRGLALRAPPSPAEQHRREAPRYRNEVPARPLSLRDAAALPPVQGPGEDVAARRAIRAGRDARTRRPSSRDGHGGEAGAISPPSLAQLAALPAVHYPGEGPHPDHHGKRAATAPGGGEGRFFQTGRTLGSVVARVCRDEGDTAGSDSAEAPLATVRKVGSRVEIAAVSPGARALGITPGLALTQARVQVPGLDVRPADPDGDRADLLRLAERLARRWTPIVAVSDDDGLLLDLTGVAHLHGGEAAMLARLVRMLARAGVTARVAVADTAGAAWAAARFGAAARVAVVAHPPQPAPSATFARAPGAAVPPDPVTPANAGMAIIPPGGQLAALAPLPVAALRLEPRALDLLARLGIASIGQLLALPRAPLVRRFGPAITTRLDQATGRAPEPLIPVRPAEPIAVVQAFAEPIATPEAIAHWLGVLFPALATALAAAGLGARAVELVADRVDGAAQRLRLGFARPTRDAAHMLRLTLRRIEEIEPGYGLDALRLHVRRSDPLGPETLGAHLAEETPPDLGPLVDALANRIGAHRLWRIAPVDSDVPERSTRGTGPLDAVAAGPTVLRLDDVRRLDERPRDHPWHPRWPRPVRLLHRPEPVDHVMAGLPDQPPRRFTWRGRTHRVVHADGPERIGGEWWRRPAERSAIRDYFHVEDEAGERFWLYRRGDGVRPETGDLSWHMHGRLA